MPGELSSRPACRVPAHLCAADADQSVWVAGCSLVEVAGNLYLPGRCLPDGEPIERDIGADDAERVAFVRPSGFFVNVVERDVRRSLSIERYNMTTRHMAIRL